MKDGILFIIKEFINNRITLVFNFLIVEKHPVYDGKKRHQIFRVAEENY